MVGAFRWRGWVVAVWLGFPALPAVVVAQELSEPVELRAAIEPDASVHVWSGGGSVHIVGWDQDSLVVTGVRTPGPGRFFSRLQPGAAKVGFEVPAPLAGEINARLEIMVPRQSTVWIKVLDAAVVVRGVEGSLDVFAVTGRIDVQGSPQTLQAESMVGRVELELEDSQVVRAKTGTGDMTFRGLAVDLTLTSIGGSIDVEGAAPRRTQIQSVDGDVFYRGGVAKGGAFIVDTHSGDIDVLLDSSVSAGVDVATVEGRISSPFPNAAPERSVPGERVFFEIGTGSAEIRIRSFSGDVVVRLPGDQEGGLTWTTNAHHRGSSPRHNERIASRLRAAARAGEFTSGPSWSSMINVARP